MSPIYSFSEVQAKNYDVSFDGIVLAVAERKGKDVKFWDLLERRWLHVHALPEPNGESAVPHALAFLPDDRRIAIVQGSHFYTMNIDDGTLEMDICIAGVEDLLESQRGVKRVLVSPDAVLAVILGEFYCAVVALREKTVVFYQCTCGKVRIMENTHNYNQKKVIRTKFFRGSCGVSSDFRYVFAMRATKECETTSAHENRACPHLKFVVTVFDTAKRTVIREYVNRQLLEGDGREGWGERMYPYKDGVWWAELFASGPREELTRMVLPEAIEQSARSLGLVNWGGLGRLQWGYPAYVLNDERFLLLIGKETEAATRQVVPYLLRKARQTTDNPRRGTAILQLCLSLALEIPLLDKVHECRTLLVLHAIDEGRPTSYFADLVAELGIFLTAICARKDYSWTQSRAFHALARDRAVYLSMQLAYAVLVALGCEEVDVCTSVPSHESLTEAELSGMASAIMVCTERGSRVQVVNMTKNRALCDATFPKFLDALKTASNIHRRQSPLREIAVAPDALSKENMERLATAIAKFPRDEGTVFKIPEMDAITPDLRISYDDLETLLASASTQLIGSEPLADVYRATMDGVAVAIREIKGGDNTEAIIEALQREISVLTTLPQHANVVILTKVVVDPRGVAKIQPLATSTLRECIDNASVTSLQHWLRILIEAARGLSYIHSHGVEHRALSPSNILIYEEDRAVISDFGSSKTHSLMVLQEKMKPDHAAQSTDTKALVYQSPEALVRNEEHRKYLLSTKSDVWSFGQIMNEVFSRQAPYRADAGDTNVEEFLYSKVALGEYVPSPAAALPTESLRRLVTKCLQFDPTKRPSAQDVVAALSDELCGTTEEIIQEHA